MGKKRVTFFLQDGPIHLAAHVASGSYLSSADLNLAAMSIGVLNRRAENNAIKTCPERCAHTHGTGLARGVERVAGE